MFQPDLFSFEEAKASPRGGGERPLDMASILARLSDCCERPRYSFMVLNLIAQICAKAGSAGPFVSEGDRNVPVRDWLSDALAPVAQRDPRRLALAAKVRCELENGGVLPNRSDEADRLVDAQVLSRVRRSGRTNVSRAVSELVRAGFVRRHYQGYLVDHRNRGGQRNAVYTITDEARRALGLGG